MEQKLKLTPTDGDLLHDPAHYRRLVGRLIYLTITRLDIVYSVHILIQFMHQPRKPHIEAILRVLRYLKGSPCQGLLFPLENNLKLTAFCDSDWASCPTTRRSTTGYCTFLGDTLISWKTKQNVVSRSSAEAEYRAMTHATCETTWLRYLLQDFQVNIPEPVGMITAAYTPSSHQLVDIFTKPLERDSFNMIIHKLGVLNLHSPT